MQFLPLLFLLAMAPKYGPLNHPIAIPLSEDHLFLSKADQPDFWALIPYYIGQKNECSCSLAVTATVLNALKVGIRKSSEDKLITQEILLSKMAKTNWPSRVKGEHCEGVSLSELRELLLLALLKFDLEKCRVDEIEMNSLERSIVQRLRDRLDRNQSSNQNFLILNIDQKLFTDDTSAGHFVVVGAWDKISQRLLILDPDREWYEPYWVSFEAAISAMHTKDSKSSKFRGLIGVDCASIP